MWGGERGTKREGVGGGRCGWDASPNKVIYTPGGKRSATRLPVCSGPDHVLTMALRYDASAASLDMPENQFLF